MSLNRKAPEVWGPEKMATQMAVAADLMAPLLEAVVGYRAQCLAAGFNETAAEFMALQYHALLLGQNVPQAQS